MVGQHLHYQLLFDIQYSTSFASTGTAPSTSTNVQRGKKASQSKSQALRKRSISSSSFPSGNSKQTSLFAFMGVKPAGVPKAATTNVDVFSGTPRERTLSTLSHALEKLDVPPPCRPNTSLGFLTADDTASDDAPTKDKSGAKDDAFVPSTPSMSAGTNRGKETGFARPTASSLRRAVTMSGPVTKLATGGSSVVARMQKRQGVTGRDRTFVGIFGRLGERASKNPTLPTVEGTPVKGSCLIEPKDITAKERGDDCKGSELASLYNVSDITGGTSDITQQDSNIEHPVRSPSSSVDKGKQRAAISTLGLNPASAALHALSQSLSSLPQTPPAAKPRAVGTRVGLRSASAATTKGSPAGDDPGSARSNVSDTSLNRSIDAGPSADGAVINGSGGGKKSSLKVLKKCAIFVDVRTDQGDDAGSLFVDMLRGLGAKVCVRNNVERCKYRVERKLINLSRSWAGSVKAAPISCLRMG